MISGSVLTPVPKGSSFLTLTVEPAMYGPPAGCVRVTDRGRVRAKNRSPLKRRGPVL